MTEIILCAAIWYKEQPISKRNPINIIEGVVVCGHRHCDCISTFVALSGKRSILPQCGEYVQGFLTNKNRFVDREEAAIIAFDAEQIKEETNKLFSEDLY